MLTNKKDEKRRGKVQLIDASGNRFWQSMRKSLGSKCREITDTACNEVTRIYNQMHNGESGWGEFSQIFFEGSIRLVQCDNQLQNVVMADALAREQAIKHFFNRALRRGKGRRKVDMFI